MRQGYFEGTGAIGRNDNSLSPASLRRETKRVTLHGAAARFDGANARGMLVAMHVCIPRTRGECNQEQRSAVCRRSVICPSRTTVLCDGNLSQRALGRGHPLLKIEPRPYLNSNNQEYPS